MGLVGGDCCKCPEVRFGPSLRTLTVYSQDELVMRWWDTLEDNTNFVLFEDDYYWNLGQFSGVNQEVGHKANYNGNILNTVSNTVTQSDQVKAGHSSASGMACVTHSTSGGAATGYIYNSSGVLQGTSFAVDRVDAPYNANCGFDGDLWAQYNNPSSPFNVQIGRYDTSGFADAYNPPSSLNVKAFKQYSTNKLIVILENATTGRFWCCKFDLLTRTFGTAVDMGWNATTNDTGQLDISDTNFAWFHDRIDVRSLSDLSQSFEETLVGLHGAINGSRVAVGRVSGNSSVGVYDLSGSLLYTVSSSNGNVDNTPGQIALTTDHMYVSAGSFLEKRLLSNGSLVSEIDTGSLNVHAIYPRGSDVYVAHFRTSV